MGVFLIVVLFVQAGMFGVLFINAAMKDKSMRGDFGRGTYTKDLSLIGPAWIKIVDFCEELGGEKCDAIISRMDVFDQATVANAISCWSSCQPQIRKSCVEAVAPALLNIPFQLSMKSQASVASLKDAIKCVSQVDLDSSDFTPASEGVRKSPKKSDHQASTGSNQHPSQMSPELPRLPEELTAICTQMEGVRSELAELNLSSKSRDELLTDLKKEISELNKNESLGRRRLL